MVHQNKPKQKQIGSLMTGTCDNNGGAVGGTGGNGSGSGGGTPIDLHPIGYVSTMMTQPAGAEVEVTLADSQNQMIDQARGLKKMTYAESGQIWATLKRAWKLQQVNDVKEMYSAVMIYLLVYGTSHRAEYTGDMMIGQHICPLVEIPKSCPNRNVRRFARANADYARSLVRLNEGLKNTLANKRNIRTEYEDLNFDFADGCTGLSSKSRAYLRSLRD